MFIPRITKLAPVTWQVRHQFQKQLYGSVTEYVRLGYDLAIRQNRQYLGFLMLLMQMQTPGMHNQVRLWASQGHLGELLNRLTKENFAVYITADHGKVTAAGIGVPKEGVLADTKGQRVRVYDREDFREEVATKFPESLRWPGYGLPPGRHVLLAGDLKAFTTEGERIVAHGGIALEEVLVPFVALGRDES